MSADTTLMPIPGPIEPVPVPRATAPRADGKVELVGLSREQIRAALETAGITARPEFVHGEDFSYDVGRRAGAALLVERTRASAGQVDAEGGGGGVPRV